MQVDSISFESFHWQNLKAPNFQQYWLNINVLAHDQSRRASFFSCRAVFFRLSLTRAHPLGQHPPGVLSPGDPFRW